MQAQQFHTIQIFSKTLKHRILDVFRVMEQYFTRPNTKEQTTNQIVTQKATNKIDGKY
jgi:hypothetical protein